jgi:NADH-quinone oxidoreductase subunit F
MAQTDPIDLSALESVLARFSSNGRSDLIPALFEAQHIYGHLPPPVVDAIGRSMRVPLAEIYGVIEFYSMLYRQPTARTIVRVCTGSVCAQAGGVGALHAACRHLVVQPLEPTRDGEYMVEEVPCLGLCDHAPAALVGDVPVARIDPSKPGTWIAKPEEAPLGAIGGEPRWLTARCGKMDALDIEAYLAAGGFQGLRKALSEIQPSEVIAEIKASGLVGRGGAAFPTGLKWEFTAGTASEPRYVVCNADESEPGTFKDRVLMEGDPFSVLEGIILAGYAISAERGYLYLRGEYPRAHGILQSAIESAYEHDYLGKSILGSDFSFDIEIRSGAGAYICGEETALFESIEGRRGYPRLKPPFPTTNGLFGQPTVINNVETLCTVTWILAHGHEAYRSIGTEGSPGSKLFCLSGDVKTPGVYEVPFGTRLGEIISLAGGVDGEVQAVLLGGAAGAFASSEQMDLQMDFEHLKEAGLPLGSGVVFVINQSRDLRQTLLGLAHFFAHESCGKCFPCQLGTQRQLEIVAKVAEGSATKGDIAALRDVGFAMTNASLCGLGMTAGTAILSALDLWPEVFMEGGK